MEEDVLNALQTRTAYLPGGYDRTGKIIIVVNIINDLQLWNRRYLELSIACLKNALSAATLQRGVTVIVDAQRSTTRITRAHARIIYGLFDDITVNLYLVRAESFWEKHVETCTNKSQTKGEPILLSKARLVKYFDLSQLPEELGGTFSFNYDLWLQQRKAIDEFQKTFDSTLTSMESLHALLLSNKSLRPAEADAELKKCAQVHTSVQQQIEVVIELGNRVLNRLAEAYASPRQITAHNPSSSVCLSAHNQISNTPTNAPHNNGFPLSSNLACNTPVSRLPLPPDLQCARARIELLLNQIERKQTEIRTAWLELLQSIREARELSHLEEGVAFVTNWILQTAELMLSRQYSIGGDVHSCEALRSAHDVLELECRETYGFYAELLYKIDAFAGVKETSAYKDLLSQRDFMQFVCRSFATRLERRRNVLITSLRFFRLVSEYFDRTTAVFETLVMGNKIAEENFDVAAENLQKLKESQLSLANLERELVKEGEKLSDMLAMPVKDALGRDLHIDYSDHICNVRDILDTTLARRNIFSDSVELQKLTLEQVTHIYTYEEDARMAIKWMEDLYSVMIKCHSHVGCNIHEIQVQKDELQTFQETGKSIYNYGCQLLEASQTLRTSCRLDENAIPQRMLQQLQHTWHRLQAISQEHMTRLRVSAVFHRSVEEYYQQLLELRLSVRNLKQTPNSSSGISSESEIRASPPIIIGRRNVNNDDDDDDDVDEGHHSSGGGGSGGSVVLSIGYASKTSTAPPMQTTTTTTPASGTVALLRDQLRKHLVVREQLLLEVGRMVRLGRLLKTRLKEPFVLDAVTGARFRNFFSKSKPEKSPDRERTHETEVVSEPENSRQRENATIENVNANVSADREFVYLKNSEPLSLSKEVETPSREKRNELEAKVEHSLNTPKPNEFQTNWNTKHEFASITNASVSSEAASKSTLEASQNKNKIEESINMLKNVETEEEDSATTSVKIGEAKCEAHIAADNGNGVQELLVTVDKALIEVSTQLNEVSVEENEKVSEGVTVANEINKRAEKLEVSSLFENLNLLLAEVGSKINATPTPNATTSKTSPEPTIAANVDKIFEISSSITVDELTTDVSSAADGGSNTMQSSSSVGTTTSDASTTDSGTIVIQPTGNNAIACMAISNKLQDIAEVAESLDAAIRDVQQDTEALAANSAGSADKKREAVRSNSGEDWQSRSTEDDSFVTASECTFTPQSHSSSYQTASGRTSSFISSGKNSFDLSEADESTFASTFDIPVDINMSFDGSDQSFVSAQQQETGASSPQQQQEVQRNHDTEDQSPDGAYALPATANEDNVSGVDNVDGSSIADIEELHSQSITPTPGDGDVEQYHFQSIPVELETELASSCIVDSTSMEVLTETVPVTSVTPEVSTCLNIEHPQQQQQTQIPNNNTNSNSNNNINNNNTNNQKPNAAWRRSKYYENITKQTIKGFL
ncbi:uncharacterized protein [Eurosta solidaginis]|uniref:uncharacterized protein isoform X2 n=1 Tax=Eurosta solidaginis TaxID=178769 RepID=UPI00353079A0